MVVHPGPYGDADDAVDDDLQPRKGLLWEYCVPGRW